VEDAGRDPQDPRPDIAVTATCVRVPVFIGHAEAVNVEFEKPITVAEARAALRKAPGVSLVDHREDEGYVTPAECAGEDAVYVSRIRKDPTVANGLSSGSSPTTCARAPPSTPCRSPNAWCRATSRTPALDPAQERLASANAARRKAGSRGSSWSCAAMICSSAAPTDAASTPWMAETARARVSSMLRALR